MGYNLNFSGWQDMRRAISDSIINQANIKANLIAQKYNTIAKTASGLLKNGLWIYDQSQRKKEEEALAQAKMAADQQVANGFEVDPMQALSASNNISGDQVKDYKRARTINGLLRYE